MPYQFSRDFCPFLKKLCWNFYCNPRAVLQLWFLGSPLICAETDRHSLRMLLAPTSLYCREHSCFVASCMHHQVLTLNLLMTFQNYHPALFLLGRLQSFKRNGGSILPILLPLEIFGHLHCHLRDLILEARFDHWGCFRPVLRFCPTFYFLCGLLGAYF